ncbi:MAG: MFS transporter [Planctomycetes bacterium]|nr:MFS transporter [Planctomycetota bacterium]
MSSAIPPEVRDRSLRVSVVDGCFHGGMVGFGENYVGAWAVFLGATPALAAALGSWPPLLGAIFGAFAVDLVDRVRRRKRITVLGAGLAGLVYPLLIALPLAFPKFAVEAVVVCWLVYFAGNSIAAPPWNSWMGDLVPSERRGAYFGRRSGLVNMVTFVCLIGAGLLLEHFRLSDRVRHGFIVCLAIAGVLKFISVGFLSRVAEPLYEPRTSDYFTFRQFLGRSLKSNFAWFTFGIALMYFCVHLSGPFFTLYQLKTLNWNYGQLMASTGVQTLVTFFTQGWWGRMGDRRGSRFVLVVSGVGCALLPVLWCFTRNFYVILLIQVLAGLAWGGFNLATSNFLFEAVTPAKRARCAAYFNVITSIGIIVGASVGAVIVAHVPAGWNLASPFLVVFALSGLLRFPVVLLWLRGVKDGERAHVELRERARELAVVVKGDPGDTQ